MRPLTVLLLRLLHARVGSSLLMQLLGTSEQVVCDRVMPYERRSLAPLVRQASGPTLARQWVSFSDEARRAHPSIELRYYAEKMACDVDALIGAGLTFRLIDVVRDPRDIYVSARAFGARLGHDAFGLRVEEPDTVNVPLFLCDIAARWPAIGTSMAGVEPLVVRYEDMVADLRAVAMVLGRKLELRLDPERVIEQAPAHRTHMTAPSILESVGRWRAELAPATATLLTHMLAAPLSRYGYSALED